MRKIVLPFLFTCLSAIAQAQLLYRISGNGLEKPSYIVGTYHLAQGSFADSIPGVYAALDACEQVYGELDIASMQDPGNMALMQQALALPEGTTLSQLFSPDEMKRIEAYARKILGEAAPMLLLQAAGMTPMALSTTFEFFNYSMKTGQTDLSNGMDLYFQRYALEHDKAVGGLETLDSQIKTLYLSTSLERQKQLLLCLVDNPDFNDMVSEQVIASYFAQDIEGVKEAMDLKLDNECDNTPEEEANLTDRRNADWLTKMPAIMSRCPTFFAVGAAHLPGEHGVLHLLRQAGYTVEGGDTTSPTQGERALSPEIFLHLNIFVPLQKNKTHFSIHQNLRTGLRRI